MAERFLLIEVKDGFLEDAEVLRVNAADFEHLPFRDVLEQLRAVNKRVRDRFGEGYISVRLSVVG